MPNIFINGQSVMVSRIDMEVEEVPSPPVNGYQTFTPGKHYYKLYGVDGEVILETSQKPLITRNGEEVTYAWNTI